MWCFLDARSTRCFLAERKMETKFKTSKPVEATSSAPTLRFSAAAEAVLGGQTEIAPNALSQVTHAMRYQ
jgi:hypothetical protein